jgi:Flp pilus assembly protein TadB
MNRLQLAATVAVLAGAAVASAVQARRLHRTTTGVDIEAAPHVGPHAALAERIERHIGEGLHLIDLDAHAVASRVLVGSTIGTLATALGAGVLVAGGRLPASPLWLVLAGVVGAGAGLMLWRDVIGRIARRRRDLGSAAADLVQLVAVGLTTDQSVDEAVRFALSVDRGADFELFRHEIAAAPLRGLTVWEALDRLGHDLDLRELRDLATAVERQGLEGVSITATVTAMATALRERALDRLEREADRANAALAGPTLCFVVTTLVFLAYPLAVRIGEAFGG